MSSPDVRVDALEALRLQECVLEPIHVPGAIQPHGLLVTVDLESFSILQASSNAAELCGFPVEELLGTPLVDLIGPDAIDQFRDILNWQGFGSNPVKVRIGERTFSAIFHDSNGLGVVELEPRTSTRRMHSANTIYAAIHRLAGASSITDLLAWGVREIRNLTGFDQVMVYRFHSDGHGEVIAESCRPGVQSYFGQHFPASDIPIQARRLYLKKMSRVIVGTETPNAHLAPPENPITGEPVDLTLAELRAISPRHHQFMKNMGQRSTLSLSLVVGGELIGMITCAHPTEMHIPFALRQGYEVLARQIALQWGAMQRIEQLTLRERLREIRQGLINQLRDATSVGAALTASAITTTSLVEAEADAAAVRIDGAIFVADGPIDEAQARMLFEYLDGAGRKSLVTDSVKADYPDLASSLPLIAGVLAVPFGAGGNYLAWFRREQVRTVEWLGDQSADNRLTPLSPRNSFATWSESVADRSSPWDEAELLEAVELSRDLETASVRSVRDGPPPARQPG